MNEETKKTLMTYLNTFADRVKEDGEFLLENFDEDEMPQKEEVEKILTEEFSTAFTNIKTKIEAL